MRFQFQALQQDGRLVTGQVEAASPRGAYRDLRARGIQPTAIVPAASRVRSGFATRKKAGRRDELYLLKELHVLVAGGVPIAEAVAALEEAATHPALAAAFARLQIGLRHGERFAVAFTRCFPAFPAYVHRIIEAGDISGRLGEALADAAAEVEREARFVTELRNALVYPAFLIAVGLLAILFMFVVVVPRFAVMFRGKFDQLPWLSYVVIAGGMWVREHLMLGAMVGTAVAAGLTYAFREPEIRNRLRGRLARLPVLGGWMAEVETARWAAVLARLLENRVPLMTSLELSRRALRGSQIQGGMIQVERAVRSGRALAAALEDHHILPGTALSLIRVGERSGNLPEMMRSVAAIYDEIVRNRIKVVLAIVEPAAILLIGGVIGLMAVAIFLAITSINNVPGL
jgi:general secretion pathway protein F